MSHKITYGWISTRHHRVGQNAIYPNHCIPWMMLSIDERIMILENNELYCKYCLRLLRAGTNGNSCGVGKHVRNTGYNGSCSVRECENNVTLCKRHEAVNRKQHRIQDGVLKILQIIYLIIMYIFYFISVKMTCLIKNVH